MSIKAAYEELGQLRVRCEQLEADNKWLKEEKEELKKALEANKIYTRRVLKRAKKAR